ncbi:MAG: recombinase family protein [Erysipelotrichales bacterium]|nr:recombinase family protein [Erysipelotrichales bacterium]
MSHLITSLKSVAIYCRLSKDDGLDGDSSSIQSQRNLLTKYAEDNEWHIFDIYIDDGYSGTNFNRPAFQKMIKDIEQNRIDIVITKDLSRLGRNYIQTGFYTDDYFPNHNVRYIALSDNFDTQKEDDPASDLVPFKNVINEWYARDTSKKIRSVFKMKNKAGILIRRPVPLYGYKYNHENNTVEIDEESASVIKYLFTAYASNTPIAIIKKYLIDNKIHTPGYYAYLKYNYNKERYGAYSEEQKYTWKNCVIDRMLSNIEYTGIYIASKTASINFKNHRRRKVDTKEYTFEGIRPQIISKELFNKVAERKAKTYRPRLQSENEVVLQGVLECAECGRKLNHKNQTLYRKDRNKIYHNHYFACRSKNCSLKAYVKYDDINQIVKNTLSSLKEFLLNKEEKFLEYAKNYKPKIKVDEKKIDTKKLIKDLNIQKAKLENQITNLFEGHVNGNIPTDLFDKLSKKYTAEVNDIIFKIKELTKPKENKETNINYFLQAKEFVDNLKKYNEDICDEEIVHLLINKIIIGKEYYDKSTRSRSNYNVLVNIRFNITNELLEF